MKNNPFDIPGLSANPDNPLLASLNMMQQIWGNMAKGPMGLSPQTGPIPTVEELNKRIEELQAVESWLRLNLSMLSSTIQGLEIQRSTLATLQSLAKSGFGAMPDLTDLMAQTNQTEAPQPESDEPTAQEPAADPTNESLRQAGQAWWDLLQNQFDTIASATTQTMQQAQHVAENMSANTATPSADSTFKAAKATPKAAKQPSAKKSTKTADATKAAKKSTKKTASSKAKKTS